MESSFYQNVFLLTQAVSPSKDFLKYFKEGMFAKPNTIGFLHISHYLLSIYDAERTKKLLKWPLFCKKEEADYRTSVKDFLTSVASENPDIGFPQILASHLLHAGGSKFSIIMWNLSTVSLRTYLRRQTGFQLLAPKTGAADDLSKMLFNNLISQSEKNIRDLDTRMNTTEEDAKKFASEIAGSIKNIQENLLLTRKNLMDLASQAPVHPAMRSRLADPNDTDVMRGWEKSIEESLSYLKSKQKRLDEIAELGNSVAAMVISIATADSNMLDGNLLPKIQTDRLSEIDGLHPETQLLLHGLYDENGVLSLEKFLELFNECLLDFHRYSKAHGFVDLSGCEEQVNASCQDMKSMAQHFEKLCERMTAITSEIKNNAPNRDDYLNPQRDASTVNANNNNNNNNNDTTIFDSVLLKSSPTIRINGNHESEGTEVNDRLELTPVENMHKALFSRHRKIDDNTQLTKFRVPKLIVSRINLDDTSASVTSERSFTPGNRSTAASKMLNPSMAPRSGRYSHLFSSYQKKSANRSNMSIMSAAGSSRNSTIVDSTSPSTDLYNISELRPHLTVGKSKLPENRDMSTPKKYTPKKRNGNRGSIINEGDKSRGKMGISPSIIDEETELTTQVGRAGPKSRSKPDKCNDRNRRTSISDLVERYKSIRENRVDETAHLENSSDISDESASIL